MQQSDLLYPIMAVGSGYAAVVVATVDATQILLRPDTEVTIPLGVLLGLFGLAIVTTAKAIRVFDRLMRKLENVPDTPKEKTDESSEKVL